MNLGKTGKDVCLLKSSTSGLWCLRRHGTKPFYFIAFNTIKMSFFAIVLFDEISNFLPVDEKLDLHKFPNLGQIYFSCILGVIFILASFEMLRNWDSSPYFELEDPSLEEKNEEATLINAIIAEEINSHEDASIYTKRYKVNVGHEKQLQVAESTDLNKFHNLQTHSENQERPTSEASKKEVLIRIAQVLKVAWNLPEKRRIKIIKRLFLQWHPEKNLGASELYNEVIQHLQNDIGKLDSSETTCNQVSSYKPFYNVSTKRAKVHHTRRQEYRAAFDKKYGSRETSKTHSSKSGIPSSFCNKNPQPGQARRWFRQAEADLRAVKQDLAVELLPTSGRVLSLTRYTA